MLWLMSHHFFSTLHFRSAISLLFLMLLLFSEFSPFHSFPFQQEVRKGITKKSFSQQNNQTKPVAVDTEVSLVRETKKDGNVRKTKSNTSAELMTRAPFLEDHKDLLPLFSYCLTRILCHLWDDSSESRRREKYHQQPDQASKRAARDDEKKGKGNSPEKGT